MDKLIAGVDEVGRGPLVGDVVTAAVILDPSNPIEGLNDSKKLSEKKRIVLAQEIREKALYWNIGRANPAEIDKLNILHATMLAMVRAVKGLPVTPDFVRVDGNRLPAWNYSSEAVVKGDSLHQEISAASIIAKVERDNDMLALHEAFPQYNFAGHKGYPTKAHFAALAEFGVLDCYRKSFKPVKALLTDDN
ncbi:ribonuclease HII [Alteromonas sp.]|uniref:ribonuclease HII n=1 Tax=Alteromonas sp. TaxID=232 RepID=UPI000B681865|nr:ribonuclease HII [Alteromonas sp.]MAI38536.1 ribonuclease HII [Alteromonas sp.]OUX85812.1 MAG: ribonuclease HII [Alteromonas sp. TMED35]